MKLRPFLVILSLLFLESHLFAGIIGGTPKPVKKSLPLDGVPNVEMKTRTNSEYLPDRIVVKLMPNINVLPTKFSFGIPTVDKVISHISGVTIERTFPFLSSPTKEGAVDLTTVYTVKFTSPEEPFSLSEELSQLPEVLYAEPWFIYPITKEFSPNDPQIGVQWGLGKVSASQAWDISQGDSTVLIGIVDSGVEWTHEDLSANIWHNPGETPGNQTDDDNNGYVDDIHGWDFAGADWANIQGDNNPSPTGSNNEHGTHVAGIADAVTNNGTGVASLGFKCKILPVKTAADNDTRGPGGEGYILTGYQGIAYAAKMHADVINCSWGGGGGAQSEQDVINFATQQGSLVVAAAGNDGTSGFFSPAGYQNVLGVAATSTNDAKASFSNYGEVVDVCAPGVNVFSTIFPNSYTYLSGTSMASPFTVGLCALVKSYFPNYNANQVGEQVRVTCDNIDNINTTYAGQLGRGRINAYKALTDTTFPSVRLASVAISDSNGGNGNGFPQPAETLSIKCNFENFLRPTTSNATVTLTTTVGTYITIVNGSFPLGALGTLQSISNAATPFRVFIKANVPQSYKVGMKLTYTDGAFTDIQTFSFLVNPTFQTHNVNKVQLTLTNNGKIGFFDFPNNTQGSGCIFNGVNHLFEAGLMIGNSATKLVNVVRNPNNVQDADFASTNFYSFTSPGVLSDQDGYTFFTDNNAPAANKIGLRVNMYSYAFASQPNDKYILIRYDISNTTLSPLTNVYVGQFYDWDLGSADQNYTNYDATRSLGYSYDAGTTNHRKEYLGVRALDSAAGFRALTNSAGIDLTRAGKWGWLSGGFATTQVGPGDIHQVISSGPYTIAAGGIQTVGFAIVAGDSTLANIQENADAAKVKWEQIKSIFSGVHDANTAMPKRFALQQNYPNPFNPATVISYSLPVNSMATLKIFDVLGREVATLVNEVKNAGNYSVSFDASHLTSGMYFYRLNAGNFTETKKMMLVK